MPKHDIEALRNAIDLCDLAERYGVELIKAGGEQEACCPFHSEKTPSFRIFEQNGRQAFYCFGCGAGGDHIDFIKESEAIGFTQACDRLAEIVGGSYTPQNVEATQKRTSSKGQKQDDWEYSTAPNPTHPAPKELWVRKNDEWISRKVVKAWPYHSAEGSLISYACRVEFEKEDGSIGKDVIPVSWMTNRQTGESRWKQRAMDYPRPPYKAKQLADNPNAQIVLVEGEKAADAGQRMLDGTGIIVTTWAGGSKAIAKTDWSLFDGRKIVSWPDADSKKNIRTGQWLPYHQQPGMFGMMQAIGQIEKAASNPTDIRIIQVPYPGNIEDGWDLADAEAEGWDTKKVISHIQENLITTTLLGDIPDFQEEPEAHDAPEFEEEQSEHDYQEYEQQGDQESHEQATVNDNPDPFRILGWDRGTAYYLPDGFRQVVSLRANDHTKLRLLELAPLHYWQNTFPTEKRSGEQVDWALAAESLIRRAQRTGLWDDQLIRGRGAWWDDGRSAVHMGDKVVIDGQDHNLGDAPGRFVYELKTRVDIATSDPLTTAESVKLVEICGNLRWQRPISGKLLAGWVFLAPICGALEWRPHIWVTGGAGSGKSTIMVQIIHRLLKDNMLFVQGETSEAGIRQELGHDAIPVVFDEIESQSEKATTRVNSIMDLMTISSSETGAKLVKGGANGKAQSYLIRSMFCFSSITVNLKQHAAKTRVTVLDMKPKPPNETDKDLKQYNDMLATIFDTLTPDYIRRLQARAVELIPVIRHNARIFAEAAAMTVGSRRFGDQVGTLIAGAYALHSSKKITPEAAREWVSSQDWEEHNEGTETQDESACLQYILGQMIRVDSETGPKTRTIGELVELAAGIGSTDEVIPETIASDTLRRHGLIVEKEAFDANALIVANSHPMLERLLAKSPWATSWNRTLARLPMTKKTSVKRFAGAPSRGISIPLSDIP